MGEDKQIKTDSTIPGTNSTEQARLLKAWRISMMQIPLPKKGCFEASYPSKEWREVPSRKASVHPTMPGRVGPPIPFTVGGGGTNDLSAQAPTGLISSATGLFDSVTGVTSESDSVGGSNAYTLQLNTNPFPLPPGTGITGAAPGCQGWEQFVFYNDGTSGQLYIQYWLLGYGTTSPGTNWSNGGPGFTSDWVIVAWANTVGHSLPLPNEPITNLANLTLRGTVSTSADSIFFSDGGPTVVSATGGNVLKAAAGWNIAEFGVFGAGGSSQANFNAGSTVVATMEIRTEITYGGTAPPNCVAASFTGETNNLSFGNKPPVSGPGPAQLVTQESTGGVMPSCGLATDVGDTHLTTFKGLLYDFQASGEFVLAEVDPDFVVQTRQVSGAPTWPNASVNSAVATRMGKTKVAVCLDSLNIDGKTTDLGDGKSLSTPDGVNITRRGNVYFITSPSGYSVRATVNASWIDVLVGLGNCSAEVKGLIANADGNVNQIAARDGTVLTNPFNFEQLYHHFADSWRVSPKESLLHTCGDQVKIGIPRTSFYARDLPQEVYERALAVSEKAGVEKGALLDAATLDVAVIGDDRAAQVFVDARPPVAVGKVVTSYGDK